MAAFEVIFGAAHHTRRHARVTVNGPGLAERSRLLSSSKFRRNRDGVSRSADSISKASSSTSRAAPRRSAPTMCWYTKRPSISSDGTRQPSTNQSAKRNERRTSSGRSLLD